MSLRDYFAAHAPDDDLADIETVGEAAALLGVSVEEYTRKSMWRVLQTRRAYEWADHMLTARQASPEAPPSEPKP